MQQPILLPGMKMGPPMSLADTSIIVGIFVGKKRTDPERVIVLVTVGQRKQFVFIKYEINEEKESSKLGGRKSKFKLQQLHDTHYYYLILYLVCTITADNISRR